MLSQGFQFLLVSHPVEDKKCLFPSLYDVEKRSLTLSRLSLVLLKASESMSLLTSGFLMTTNPVLVDVKTNAF